MKTGCFTGNCNLDERQLWQQGRVFKHTTILLFSLILFNGMLKDYGITWAEGRNENLLIFWAAAALGLCEYSLRDISPAGTRQKILYSFFGLGGAVLIMLALHHVLAGQRPVLAGGMLTSVGSGLLQGAAMLAIFLTDAGRRLYDRRRLTRGGED